ncbi:MAG: hypothetical protein OEN20_00785 [Gammaproteobacteria bacterium]|nr:hypothetical protein [Gammaproteobacteria bacterium]
MIERIEIKGEGVSTAPPFDLEAIQQRAMSLDGNSQVATDIYQLIRQVKQLQAALDAKT